MLLQVDNDFETEDIDGPKDVNMGKKASTKDQVSASSARHLAFLQRCEQGSQQSWQPRALHRQAARRWLDNLDNQLRWSLGSQLGKSGLARFAYDEKSAVHESGNLVLYRALLVLTFG